jgi:hypothetical protein
MFLALASSIFSSEVINSVPFSTLVIMCDCKFSSASTSTK